MSTISRSAMFWDRVARKYAQSPVANVDAYERTLERTRSHLRPNDTVLEIGAGTSSTALRLAPSVAHYTATDISEEMSQIGREKLAQTDLTNLHILKAELGDPAIGTGPYDAVLTFNVLHLMGPLSDEAVRIHGLLPKGGLFISKTACLGGIFRIMAPMIWVMRLFGKAPSVQWFTPAKLEATIAAAGFDIIEAANDPGTIPRRYIVARKI